MPDISIVNLRAKSDFILEIPQWDLRKFHFYEIANEFYVSIISVMTHQNDVTTRLVVFGSERVLLLYISGENILQFQLTIKQA